MRNIAQWRPSKFHLVGGKLFPTRDTRQLGIASRLMAASIADIYTAALPVHARGRLLDLGCGNVPLYQGYRDHVSECVCVDWGLSLHESLHLDFTCDLNSTLPFGDGEFDTILLSDVLEHIATPDNLWREMSRLLSPRGKILLNVPFYYGIHEAPHDYYRYTQFALRRFAAESGLDVVMLEAFGGIPEIMTDLFAKAAIRLPVIGSPLAVTAQWLTRNLRHTWPLKRMSDATREGFPLGYFMVAAKT